MTNHGTISSGFLRGSACLCVLLASVAAVRAGDIAPQTTYHQDSRRTPSQDFITPEKGERRPTTRSPSASSEARVLEFLRKHAARYGLADDLADIELVGKQKSLLGTHYRFRQVFAGKEVISGEIVVTTDVANDVVRISNNIFPRGDNKAGTPAPAIDLERALDAAWKDLKVVQSAKVLDEPKVDLKYLPVDQTFKLVYDVRIAVSEPHGYWQYLIDANTGQIIQKQNRATDLSNSPEGAPRGSPGGPLAEREALLRRFRQNSKTERPRTRAPVAAAQRMDGTALVFDPDPVTALQDGTLNKDDPAAKFERAYAKRPLLGLTKRSGAVYLEGPFVQLTDFEDPVSAPSSTADGNWTAKRGDNAFNDAMTYYHIDRAQRHLQALGFTGLIDRPIEVDANGVSGNDNSHHIPSDDGRSGRLAFGHGCVADNEDAAVIWHEYGHAIHAEIVGSNWKGGDARAIGEGFGDYWAATLGLAAINGPEFEPDKVFRWDGTPACWPGRSTNRKGIRYDPSRTYRDHVPIDGGGVSDELWSSPLVQSMRALVAQGYPRDDADKIVLQGMFGVTSAGFTMHDLAQLTVLAAKTLYPQGPHGEVFLKQFQAFNICQPDTNDKCAPPDRMDQVSKTSPVTVEQEDVAKTRR